MHNTTHACKYMYMHAPIHTSTQKFMHKRIHTCMHEYTDADPWHTYICTSDMSYTYMYTYDIHIIHTNLHSSPKEKPEASHVQLAKMRFVPPLEGIHGIVLKAPGSLHDGVHVRSCVLYVHASFTSAMPLIGLSLSVCGRARRQRVTVCLNQRWHHVFAVHSSMSSYTCSVPMHTEYRWNLAICLCAHKHTMVACANVTRNRRNKAYAGCMHTCTHAHVHA
jgi:hypothetical protein